MKAGIEEACKSSHCDYFQKQLDKCAADVSLATETHPLRSLRRVGKLANATAASSCSSQLEPRGQFGLTVLRNHSSLRQAYGLGRWRLAIARTVGSNTSISSSASTNA